MEQFRQIGEVLGSLRALMVLKDDIQINQRQCCLLSDIFNLAFDTIAEEIKHNLKIEEKNTKWKALEQPLKEIHRVFKEAELYIKHCIDSKDWWGKVISLHQNKDCVEFHIYNLFCYFPAVIEAIENAGEISGLDQDEMQKKRVLLLRKYDNEWNDPELFQWRFGKQYLVPKETCYRLEAAWKEDRWLLIESLKQKKSLGCNLSKNEQRLGDWLLKKLNESESAGKLFPGSIMVGGKDYQVRRRLGSGGQYKEIQWLGESFALRHFFADIEPLSSEISDLLQFSHPNIVQYLCGFYDEEKKECSLVMELMNKDLITYIKENNGPRRRILFSLPVVVDIMLQIARGMQYLHSRKLYHGELNPSNVYLKSRNNTEGYFRAKISGFGLSSVKNRSSRDSANQTETDNSIWYAPEVLLEQERPSSTTTSKQTEKADVYSFGMLCFMLLTGKVPFEDSHLQGEKMIHNIRAGERPLFPFPCPKCLASLIKRCWQNDHSQRPSSSSICRILRYIKKFLVMNPDVGQPLLQTPSVDYFDIEARFLKKFKGEGGPAMELVSQIPFQMFSYRLLEKEKVSVSFKEKNWDSASDTVSICKDDKVSTCKDDNVSIWKFDSLSVIEEPFMSACDTRSICSDMRSVCSEAPVKKIQRAKKLPNVRTKNGSSGLPNTQSARQSPTNSPGRRAKMNRDSLLPLAMSPLREGRRRTFGHLSDSELH